MVRLVSFFMFALNMIINIDHGALPAALSNISQDLQIDESVMGSMGSSVFFGLIVGSTCASWIFKHCAYKPILTSSLLLNGVSLLLFTLDSNFNYMCIARFMAGFSQIFITIYMPLFVDTYISPKSKPAMLSGLLVAAPLGVVAGYSMTSVCVLNHGFWKSHTPFTWYQSFRL